MNEVNKTLFIPLYGKSTVSEQHIILSDPDAERIWQAESFPIRGKSKSKWLAYNMAMRARVFDDWTDSMLRKHKDALVLHIGCGLDSRFRRVKEPYRLWIDCDLPDVIAIRKEYFDESGNYRMQALDASVPAQVAQLPESDTAIVILEGISMYLSKEQLRGFLEALQKKYRVLCILMDIYTEFGAKASKYRNPVNDVGVTKLQHGRSDRRAGTARSERALFYSTGAGKRIEACGQNFFQSVVYRAPVRKNLQADGTRDSAGARRLRRGID